MIKTLRLKIDMIAERFNITKTIKSDTEVILLLLVFAYWYLSNLDGSLGIDGGLYTIAGYKLITFQNIYFIPELPPLIKYFIGIGQIIFGETLFGAKFASLFFGVLSLYLTYKIGEKVGNKLVGLISTILLGMTYLFSSHVVTAMLDVPHTFFVLLLFYITTVYIESDLHKPNTGKKRMLFLMGMASTFAFTSKYYGIYFVLVVFLFVFYKNIINSKMLLNRDVGYFTAGLVIFFLLIYFPYLRIDYPGVSYELSVLAVPKQELVDYLPDMPSIFYVLGYTYANYFLGESNIASGGALYEYSYLYMIMQHGGFTYTVGLIIVITYVSLIVLKKDRSNFQFLLLLLYAFIPLILLSISPATKARYPRYLIPLLPLFSILIVTSTFESIKFMFKNKSYRSCIAFCAVLVLLLLPTSPILSTLKSPKLSEDTVYSDVARNLIEHARNNPNDNIIVAAPHILNHYIGLKKPSNLLIEDLPYTWWDSKHSENYSEVLYEKIKRGDVKIIFEGVPYGFNYSQKEFKFTVNKEIHDYIITHAKLRLIKTDGKSEWYLYYLNQ